MIAVMTKKSRSFTRNAFRPMLQHPSCTCGSCKKEDGADINDKPIDVEEMLPEEREAYDKLVTSYGERTTVSDTLFDRLVASSMKYAGEIIDGDDYWTRVLPREVWLEELEPLIQEGLKGYLSDLDEQLEETAGKLEDPYSDSRMRTIAATESTIARTCASILLSDLNNTISAVLKGQV